MEWMVHFANCNSNAHWYFWIESIDLEQTQSVRLGTVLENQTPRNWRKIGINFRIVCPAFPWSIHQTQSHWDFQPEANINRQPIRERRYFANKFQNRFSRSPLNQRQSSLHLCVKWRMHWQTGNQNDYFFLNRGNWDSRAKINPCEWGDFWRIKRRPNGRVFVKFSPEASSEFPKDFQNSQACGQK